MAKRVIVNAYYHGDADEIFASAQNFEELKDAMKGFARYEGIEDKPAKEGQTYTVDVTFWGFYTVRGHVIHLETLNQEERWMQSREHSPQIKRWDHHLSVHPDGDRVRWADSIIIDAGWQTFGAARFAAFVYQRRHRHRQALEITTRFETAE